MSCPIQTWLPRRPLLTSPPTLSVPPISNTLITPRLPQSGAPGPSYDAVISYSMSSSEDSRISPSGVLSQLTQLPHDVLLVLFSTLDAVSVL